MKIIEKILEPSKIFTGSIFKLKIKAIRYLKYKEIQIKDYSYNKNYTYKDFKGD